MGTKISHILLENNFFSALGTTERSADSSEGTMVKRGIPLTYDYNGGVMVVYDEEGRPWIRAGNSLISWIDDLGLKRGAHVPHSSDGGRFLREVVNKL